MIITDLRGFVNGPLCKNSVLPFGGGVGYTTELLQSRGKWGTLNQGAR